LFCPNPDCYFVTNPAFQAVVTGLIDVGRTLIDACAIAVEYVPVGEDQPSIVATQEAALHRFAVTDRREAEWVAKKIAVADAKIADAISVRNAEVARLEAEIKAIDARTDQIIKPFQRDIEFFTLAYGPQLEAWVMAEIAGGKAKSVKLLYADAGFKKERDKVIVPDELIAICWAETACPQAVKKSLLVSKIDRTEAISAGVVKIEPGADKFYFDAKMPLEVKS
jgi:hypothetical protein